MSVKGSLRENLPCHLANAWTLCYLRSKRTFFSVLLWYQITQNMLNSHSGCIAQCFTSPLLSPSILTLLPHHVKRSKMVLVVFKATQLFTSSWSGQDMMNGSHSEAKLAGKNQIASVPVFRSMAQVNHLGVSQTRPAISSPVKWMQKLANMFLWHILGRQSGWVTGRFPSGDKTCRRMALH